MTDVLILGGDAAYSYETIQTHGLGGCELEVLQVAQALTARGYTVTIANHRDTACVQHGVSFVPLAQPDQHRPSRAVLCQRYTPWPTNLLQWDGVRIVVRAVDTYMPAYDHVREAVTSDRAAVVVNTPDQFASWNFAKEPIVVPPMLEQMPDLPKIPGLFVFPSGPEKGLEPTLVRWRRLKRTHRSALLHCQLVLVSPGWGDFPELTDEDRAARISVVHPNPDGYRRLIAFAEGLFMELHTSETYCCAAALAERAGTRPHILADSGLGGIPYAVTDEGMQVITTNPQEFDELFLACLGETWPRRSKRDNRPETVVCEWEVALELV